MTRGNDALAAMPKMIIGEIRPKANATLWAWLSRVPIDLKTSRRSHNETTTSKTMTTGGKRLRDGAKAPAMKRIGKNAAARMRNAPGLQTGPGLTHLRKAAVKLFSAPKSNATTMHA